MGDEHGSGDSDHPADPSDTRDGDETDVPTDETATGDAPADEETDAGPPSGSDDVGDDAQSGADGATDDAPSQGATSPDGVDPDVDADVVEFSAASGDDDAEDVDDADDADGVDDADGGDADATDGPDETGQVAPRPFGNPALSTDDGNDGSDDDAGGDREDAVVGDRDGTYEWEGDDDRAGPDGEDLDATDVDPDEETVETAADIDPWADREAAETEGVGGSASSASPPSPSPGATAVGAGAGPGAGGGTVGGGSGTATAPDDQEMPLTEHIEEMIGRLGVVLVVMALVSGVVFPFADRLINFLWYSFLPGTVGQCPVPPPGTDPNDVACPTLYHPLALMFARLKIASLAGFVVALPVMVYESYLFMRPGLYPRERRYYLASVPTSLVLAGVGVLFAYFLVLPVLFQYFTGYTSSAATIAFGLTDTFNLIVMMLGFFALVFQIPLLLMLAIMMGVTSRRWLADKRLYFWGAFATIAFIFSPDPTGMAPILVAVTMIGLFEGTLFLLKWTGN
jgi:sec-independent protein translocase protein TatC